MDTIDLRTPNLSAPGFDSDAPTGAAAAFAVLAFLGCCVGVLAGAVVF